MASRSRASSSARRARASRKVALPARRSKTTAVSVERGYRSSREPDSDPSSADSSGGRPLTASSSPARYAATRASGSSENRNSMWDSPGPDTAAVGTGVTRPSIEGAGDGTDDTADGAGDTADAVGPGATASSLASPAFHDRSR